VRQLRGCAANRRYDALVWPAWLVPVLGSEWDRGRVVLDQFAVYAAVDAQRRSQGIPWTAVSREIGVAPSTIARLQAGKAAETDGLLAILRWLGSTPEDFAGQAPGGTVRALGPGRLNTQWLFEALDEKRTESGLNWTHVAAEVGGTTGVALRALARGGRIHIDLLLGCLRWLGRSSGDFVDPDFQHP